MSSLDRIQVARPCPANWDEMTGDARVRFCALCKLNVYNLSAMKREEAEALVAAREGRVCVRFFRRADGTLLTEDCPVGLAAVRRRVAKVAASFAAALTLGWAAIAGRGRDEADGPLVEKPAARAPRCPPMQGEVAARPVVAETPRKMPTRREVVPDPPVAPARPAVGKKATEPPSPADPAETPGRVKPEEPFMGELDAPKR